MSNTLHTEDNTVVAPGEVLADGMDYLPGDGTYRSGEQVIAGRLGLLQIDDNVLKTIALAGRYIPQDGDRVVGRVKDIMMSGWRLDLNSAYSAVLSLKDASHKYIERDEDLTDYFDLGDYIFCKITQVTTQNLVDVTCKDDNLGKLSGGMVAEVNPSKVPRIIGKRGSMVSVIKKHTGCEITVGQNGYLWVKGEPEKERIALDTVRLVEKKSHVQGLTEQVKRYLKRRLQE